MRTLVVAPRQPGAEAFDRASPVEVRRAPAPPGPGSARAGALNAAALCNALAFRPQLALVAHIVASPAAAAMRRALGTRTAQYFHAEEIGAWPRLAAFAAREADAVISVSRYTTGLIEATGVTPTRLSLIPGGVDIPTDPSPLPSERPMVLTISRLAERYKGHDVMIRALPLVLARVPDAIWVVIGDGPLRPAHEALARAYGVDGAVRFLGNVSDAERDAWLRRCKLLAMPSRLPGGRFAGEGFGIVYLEAGAYGKPVLAGNDGGALDAVGDGESGLLVDPTDPVLVADGIARLLLDEELARRLGEGGRRRAHARAWPLVCEQVRNVLLELLP
jgi:phosphatidylinositol alpha-1,6-mannosyltransferase